MKRAKTPWRAWMPEHEREAKRVYEGRRRGALRDKAEREERLVPVRHAPLKGK